jgi:hypothetical protein
MGLDQYLNKKTYIGANYEHNEVVGEINLFKRGEKVNIDLKKVTYIEEEFGYWRKANAIHKWFVDNVQDGKDDCGDYYVGTEDLQKLLDAINEILKDNSKAEDLLPTESGFFFGDTEYNDWYIEKLKYTKDLLEQAVRDTTSEYHYTSSW